MRTGVVYKITNPKGLVYIGSTMSFKKRVGFYRNIKCKGQRKLFASLLKHGFKAHKIEIIDTVIECDLKRKEREYGLFYNVLDEKYGLNSMLPGYGDVKALWSKDFKDKHADRSRLQIAIARTEEEKSKISLNSKRVKPSEETMRKSRAKLIRPIIQFSINGSIIKEFESTIDAASETGVSRSNIKNNLNGYTGSAGGFVWKFKDGIKKGKNNRKITQRDMSGNLIKIHDSVSQAARSVNLNWSSIRYVAKGKVKTAGGFVWEYSNEERSSVWPL